MQFLEPQVVKNGFEKQNLEVITERKILEKKLKQYHFNNTNFLFMSSGNYDGMDILATLNVEF
jgi:hypothetical protein